MPPFQQKMGGGGIKPASGEEDTSNERQGGKAGAEEALFSKRAKPPHILQVDPGVTPVLKSGSRRPWKTRAAEARGLDLWQLRG